jgi:hypothetical protein
VPWGRLQPGYGDLEPAGRRAHRDPARRGVMSAPLVRRRHSRRPRDAVPVTRISGSAGAESSAGLHARSTCRQAGFDSRVALDVDQHGLSDDRADFSGAPRMAQPSGSRPRQVDARP